MISKDKKIVVVGLPKTGTSTLTVMLRILGYKVTGPDIAFKPQDVIYLERNFEVFDAFQDYPWCFEWERYISDPRVLFIELKRDKLSWWKSFLNSYGGKGKGFLSYPYFGIEKYQENKELFIDFFVNYYANFESFKLREPERVLTIDVGVFGWEELCAFLKEPLPRDIFGKLVKKPHVNKLNYLNKNATRTIFLKKIKKLLIPLLGIENWQKTVIFFRKNGLDF